MAAWEFEMRVHFVLLSINNCHAHRHARAHWVSRSANLLGQLPGTHREFSCMLTLDDDLDLAFLEKHRNAEVMTFGYAAALDDDRDRALLVRRSRIVRSRIRGSVRIRTVIKADAEVVPARWPAGKLELASR